MSTARLVHDQLAVRVGLLTSLLLVALSVSGVTLGPRAHDTSTERAREAPEADAPSLRLAIPLLDAGVPEDKEEQFDRRIWPELRNAESVRIAVKLKEAIEALGTFPEVIVSPDTSASADFYLLARIEASNGEDLRLGWRLMDAAQRSWIPSACPPRCWRTTKYRLWEGWHDAHDAEHEDPFAPLYTEVAGDVHRAIALLRKKDRRTHPSRLSDLDRATTTRAVVFASFFSPELYGDAVIQHPRGFLELDHLPARDSDDWARIESIRARDERFAMLVSDQYLGLAAQMQKTYSDWQKDNFPLAREARLARREATLSAVLGGIAAAGAVAAAVDGGNPKDTSAVLAAAGAVAIANSVSERKKAEAMHAQINEIGATVHGALKPMVVATRHRTVTLTGTAREQFLQWRELLRDLYENTLTDIEAVQFAPSGEA